MSRAALNAHLERYGSPFLSPDAMRFFDSRVLPSTITRGLRDGEVWFVTSERYDESSPRLYTIRHVTKHAKGDGSGSYLDVDTWGEFQEYASAYRATKDMVSHLYSRYGLY